MKMKITDDANDLGGDELLDVDRWKKLADVDGLQPDPEEALDPDPIVTTSGHAWEVRVTRAVAPLIDGAMADHLIRLITPARDIASVTKTLVETHGDHVASALKGIEYLGPISGRGSLNDKNVCTKLLRLAELETLHMNLAKDAKEINAAVDSLGVERRERVRSKIRELLSISTNDTHPFWLESDAKDDPFNFAEKIKEAVEEPPTPPEDTVQRSPVQSKLYSPAIEALATHHLMHDRDAAAARLGEIPKGITHDTGCDEAS
jgi:hypothetical protein